MIEKRKFTRFALGAEIRWKRVLGEEDASDSHWSQTRDMSAGGLSFEMAPDIAAGDTLLLEIKLTADRTIYSKGRVVWMNPFAQIKGWTIPIIEGGVEFLNMDDEERKEIDDFVLRSHQS